MFIQTEDTPNPLTVKFIPGKTVLEEGTAEYLVEDIGSAPLLVQKILTIQGISSVFLGADFVSVSKVVEAEWPLLRPAILSAIMGYYATHTRVDLEKKETISSEEDSEIVKEIKELLETRIRPAVAQDGGDIAFERFEDGVVYVRLQGACAGCPSSTLTLKSGIENMLRHYIPEVEEVRSAE
ncbi:MAG: NifU family protein [Alphaproteobacteria bacterium]|nr:NifU family protein [Alphaproteobacteria bacterium]